MNEGDKQAWLNWLRACDQKFLQGVMLVWQAAVSGLPDDVEEDAITGALVARLRGNPNTRALFHYYDLQHPPIRLTEGQVEGHRLRIDLAVVVDQQRGTYLAYECKKLNVRHADGAPRSQAGRYVGEDGMMRFVTGKYAGDLPVACMLGYVMDGNLQWAYTRVTASVTSHRRALGLQGPPRPVSPIGVFQRFVTEHDRGSGPIEIRHALLPLAAGSAS